MSKPNTAPENLSPSERTDKHFSKVEKEIAFLTVVVAVAGVLVTSLQAWIARGEAKTAELELQRNQRIYSVDIVLDWDDNTADHKKVIESLYPGLYSTGDERLSEDEARELYLAGEGDATMYQVRQSAVALLNYFEFISTACLFEIADREVIERSLRAPMERWYEVLGSFVDEYNRQRERCVWPPYEDLIAEWRGERSRCKDFPR